MDYQLCLRFQMKNSFDKIRKLHNKLFPDELDRIRHNKYTLPQTRLKIKQKQILVVSTPKGISNEKVFNYSY